MKAYDFRFHYNIDSTERVMNFLLHNDGKLSISESGNHVIATVEWSDFRCTVTATKGKSPDLMFNLAAVLKRVEDNARRGVSPMRVL